MGSAGQNPGKMLTTDPNMLDSSLSLSGPELRICLQVTLSAPGPHTYGIYLAPAAGLMCFSQASHKQHFPPAPSHLKYRVSSIDCCCSVLRLPCPGLAMNLLSLLTPRPAPVAEEAGQARMNFFDLANLLDNDGNLQVDIIYCLYYLLSTLSTGHRY